MLLIFFVNFVPSAYADTWSSATPRASGPDYVASLPHTTFLPENGAVNNYDIGLSVKFESPIPCIYEGGNLNEFTMYTDGSNNYAAAVSGVLVTFTNNTDNLLIIKFNQSNISLGSLSAVPFIDGMKYKDAGNPSATPDAIIPPHTSIQKQIYADYFQFTNGSWIVNGTPVLRDNSLSAKLYLKIEKEDSTSSYLTIQSPNMGIS